MPARGATKGPPSFYNARVDRPSPRAVAITLLAIAAWAAAPTRPWGGSDCAFGEATYQEAGESLLHAFEPGPRPASYHLPLAAGLTACLRGHVTEEARGNWRRAAGAVVPASAALVAALAGGPAAAAAAGAAAAWGQPEPPCHPQAAFTFFAALVAGTFVLWSRRPTAARAAAVAAAAGASLALRSTFVFLPPLAALWSWRRGARRGALILALAPWALPLVWAACNLSLHGRFAPFEMGQASSNLVVGALGLVGTVEGDLDSLAPNLPDGLDTGATARWAVREALSHPRRTLDAFVARLVFAVKTAPLLWAAALVGFLAARRRPEARALAFIVAAFTALHSMMAVQSNYFLPLTPLLAGLATAPLWVRRARLGPLIDRPAGWAAWGVLAAALGVGLGGAAWAAGLTVRHTWLAGQRPVDSEAALEAALAKAPEDAVLRYWQGGRSLVQGRLSAAALSFDAAEASGLDRARPLAAWARFLGGLQSGDGFSDERGLSCGERALSSMFRAEAAARGGRADAGALAGAALDAKRSCAAARAGGAPALFTDAAALRGLLAELGAVTPGGQELSSPRLLGETLAPGDAAAWRALAIGLQDLGDADGALDAFGRIGAPSADVLSDKAVALAISGRVGEAKALLTDALQADPGLAAAALTLGALLEGEGRAAEAKAVYQRALAAGGGRLRGELERRLRAPNKT